MNRTEKILILLSQTISLKNGNSFHNNLKCVKYFARLGSDFGHKVMVTDTKRDLAGMTTSERGRLCLRRSDKIFYKKHPQLGMFEMVIVL